MYRTILIVALMAAAAIAQNSAPSFEVASIKPSPAFMVWSGFKPSEGGRFEASHATLKAMVSYAYEVRDFYVSGGPGWTGTDRFEILAKADEKATLAEMRLMLRTLLEERFKLAVHRETKDAIVYQLVVAKGAPKLEEGAGEGFIRFSGRGQVDGHGVKMDGLAGYLQTLLGQVVVDKTGLTATYNFKLAWTPDESQAGRPGAQGDAPTETGPSIFTALQEQLGLKLDGTKGPVETIVIDHAEKSSDN